MNGQLGYFLAGILDGAALAHLAGALWYRRDVRRRALQNAQKILEMGK